MIRASAFLLLFPLLIPPQELKVEVLDLLKSSTCYVVVNSSERTSVGAGFLFQQKDNTGCVLTCEHVVEGSLAATVVYWSGTPDEQRVTGLIIARDKRRDLAFLKVPLPQTKGGKKPSTLELAKKTEVRETQSVFAAGFPFGDLLSADKQHPEITVTPASVGSIRKAQNGAVLAVQMSGDINPGHSGGPVINAAGKVIGVTVAKVRNTQTAFAIPPEHVAAFLDGDLCGVKFRKSAGTDTSADYEVRADIVDPLGAFTLGQVAYIPQSKVKDAPKPGADGSWSKVDSAMRTMSLKLSGPGPSAVLSLKRGAKDPKAEMLWVQVGLKRSAGGMVWSEPVSLTVIFSEDVDRPDSAPEPAPPPPKVILPELEVPNELVRSGKLGLRSSIAALALSPDGSKLYALDLSEALLYRIDTDSWTLEKKIPMPVDAATMTLTPDGTTIYVGLRSTPTRSSDPPGGGLMVIAAPSMELKRTLLIPAGPFEIVATDSGYVGVTAPLNRDGMIIVDTKTDTVIKVRDDDRSDVIRLAPDQSRFHAVASQKDQSAFRSVSFPQAPSSKGTPAFAQAASLPVGGTFEISPDGTSIVTGRGTALRFKSSVRTEIEFVAQLAPADLVCMPRGSSTLLMAGPGNELRVIRMSDFGIVKAIRLPEPLLKAVADSGRRRLFAVARLPGEPPERPRGSNPHHGIGDLVKYDLGKP